MFVLYFILKSTFFNSYILGGQILSETDGGKIYTDMTILNHLSPSVTQNPLWPPFTLLGSKHFRLEDRFDRFDQLCLWFRPCGSQILVGHMWCFHSTTIRKGKKSRKNILISGSISDTTDPAVLSNSDTL